MKYFAERQEDEVLDRLNILPSYGCYVDVGANHPYLGNNTAFVRARGWTGVSIDALDYSAEYNTPFVQAIVSNSPEVFFLDACNPLLARVCDHPRASMRKTRTLESILQDQGIGKIDLLSLDLEGGEYDAFLSMSFECHRPTIVIAEYGTHEVEGEGTLYDYRLRDHLLSLKYEQIHDNGCNHIFMLK